MSAKHAQHRSNGDGVGLKLGIREGVSEGDLLGDAEGLTLGWAVGNVVGDSLGIRDGVRDGLRVLLPGKKSIEYFSSLGNSPSKELQLLDEPKAIFEELLGTRFNYNRRALQSGKYDVNDCAAWVLLRVHFRKMKLREFQALFSRRVSLQSPDDIAAIMAIALFQDL